MAFNQKTDAQTVSLFLKVLAECSKLSEKNESVLSWKRINTKWENYDTALFSQKTDMIEKYAAVQGEDTLIFTVSADGLYKLELVSGGDVRTVPYLDTENCRANLAALCECVREQHEITVHRLCRKLEALRIDLNR